MPAKKRVTFGEGGGQPPWLEAVLEPLRRRLDSLDARVDTLDGAIREVHPTYSGRILDRMHELEKVSREHCNQLLGILKSYKEDLGNLESKTRFGCEASVVKAEASMLRLNQATERHCADAAALRQELGSLKTALDSHSEEIEDSKREAEAMLEEAKALAQRAAAVGQQQSAAAASAATQPLGQLVGTVPGTAPARGRPLSDSQRHQDFKSGQVRVLRRSRSMSADSLGLAEVVRDAQQLALSRSPSASREASWTPRR